MAYRFLAGVVALALISCSQLIRAQSGTQEPNVRFRLNRYRNLETKAFRPTTQGNSPGIGHGVPPPPPVPENDGGFISNRFKDLESIAHSPGMGHGGKSPPVLENDAGHALNRFKELKGSVPSPCIGHCDKKSQVLENDGDFILNPFKDLESTEPRHDPRRPEYNPPLPHAN